MLYVIAFFLLIVAAVCLLVSEGTSADAHDLLLVASLVLACSGVCTLVVAVAETIKELTA